MSRSAGFTLLLALTIPGGPLLAAAPKQAQQPNIVIMLTDNLGWGEIGIQGSARGVPTPRLDKLAAQGIRLTNFNVEYSCVVSRAALLTGRYAVRTGAAQPSGITLWEVTMAEALKSVGYATGHYGKWHLGGEKDWRGQREPTNQGFDEWYGIPQSSNEAQVTSMPGYDRAKTPPPYIWEGKAGQPAQQVKVFDLESRRTLDRESATKGIDFMERSVRAGKPFFLWSGARAQTIRGTVTDSATTKPLRAAVELLDRAGKIAVQALSGEDGKYVLRAPAPDSFVVRVRRIGYLTLQSDRVALGRETDAALDVRLQSRAFAMPSVTISGKRGSAFLETVGFYRRMQETTGYFLDPDKTEKLASKAKQTADIVDGIPGVTIRSYRGSFGVRVPVLTRQLGCAGTQVEDDQPAATQWPRIYVDGMLMNLGYEGFDMNTVPAHEILAMEVYDSVSEIPLQYGGTDATCGVLVIWTKR